MSCIFKRINEVIYHLFFSMFLSLFLFDNLIKTTDKSLFYNMAGFSESIDELGKIVDSIKAIFDLITTVISTLNSIFGLSVILLFIAVVILSAGLSALGLPKGKITFFSSLLIADFFWYIWYYAQNPETYGFIWSIFKTSFILISPYIVIMLLKFLIPTLYEEIRKKVLYKKAIPKKDLVRIYSDLSDDWNSFSSNYQEMLLENEDSVVISTQVNEDVDRILKKFESLQKLPKLTSLRLKKTSIERKIEENTVED